MIGFAAHPQGLPTLFFTELWERFSFYGLQAILILYLVLPVAEGGQGYSVERAALIYGNYTMSVYLLSVLGGHLSDRLLGAPRAVAIGAIIIIAGHVCLAWGAEGSLFAGLACVAIGTSLLKPNVTTLVGSLYARTDPRRDAGFSLYYMGINVGAFIAPLICGYLAQGEGFRQWLAQAGIDPRQSWHWAFGAAGLGMLAGLITFSFSWRHVRTVRPEILSGMQDTQDLQPGARLAAIAFFCMCALVFFSMSKQAGSSLNLFADRLTRSEMFGWQFPSSWFQSVAALWVIVLAPFFSSLWLHLGTRQPSSPAKAVIGLSAAGLSFVIMMLAAQASGLGRVSPLWLVAVYFVQTIGEMCVSPVGLSNVARLAPPRRVGLMMGLWFVAIAFGAQLAGLSAAWMGSGSAEKLGRIFGQQAVIVAAACIVLALLVRPVQGAIRKLEKA